MCTYCRTETEALICRVKSWQNVLSGAFHSVAELAPLLDSARSASISSPEQFGTVTYSRAGLGRLLEEAMEELRSANGLLDHLQMI